MSKPVLRCFLFGICFVFSTSCLSAASKYTLSSMPRINAHTHADNLEKMEGFMEVRRILKEQYDMRMEAFIDLGAPWGRRFRNWGGPDSPFNDVKKRMAFYKKAKDKFEGRFVPCIHDWYIGDGLEFTPKQIVEWKERGIGGFKIWVKWAEGIDSPQFDPVFAKMEEIGMVAAAVHIADPYPGVFCDDPVKFWRMHHQWQRVLDKHPDLVVVNAHMLNLSRSDEQLDRLIYMFETYPNLNIELSATFRRFHHPSREKFRNFLIKYADRILVGFDLGSRVNPGNYQWVADRIHMSFSLLESDRMITYQPYKESKQQMKGLALPIEALEKIYYKNAIRIYPRAKEALLGLGYAVN